LDIEIGYLSGIPDRIVIEPEGPPVKGRYMGPETAFGPPEYGGPENTFLGGKKIGFPVGLSRRPDPENQGGIGKTTDHRIVS
jgi:hypothetical protein